MRILIYLLLASLPAFAQAPAQPAAHQQRPSPRAQDRLQREVFHELNLLPNYSLFDILSYQVKGSTVILSGKVRTPFLKGSAEDAVRHIEGVEKVQNDIKVLPPFADDDRIRTEVARTLFNTPGMMRYVIGSLPPIRIIVETGNVSLEGIVSSQGDKDLIRMKTLGVPGVISVTNDLRVEK